MKFPKINGVVRWSGGQTVLRVSDPWDDDAELVAERPDLFGTKPGKIRGSRRDVEQATAAPGEKRRGKLRGD